MDTKNHVLHHVSLMVVMLIILLIVVGVLVCAQIFSFFPFSSDGLNFSNNTTLEEKKSIILDRVTDGVPLTSSEKQLIDDQFSPRKINQYHLSNDEIEKVIKAMNK